MVKGMRSDVEISVSPWWVHLVFINQDEFQGNKVTLMSCKMKAPEWKVYFMPLDGQ